MTFAKFGLKEANLLRFPFKVMIFAYLGFKSGFQVMISFDFPFKVTIFANSSLKWLSSNHILKFHV